MSDKSFKPAITPEGREDQMISLALDLAEQKLRDGTAPSQLIVHFLKLASMKEQTEQLKLKKEIELLEAKTSSIKQAQENETLYIEAIKALRDYSGDNND